MRNLGLIISFWLAAFSLPTHVLALGLGEIEVNSFLNQPLKAEIEVISARPGEIDDLLVGLASRDAFSRAGLSRPNNLSDLRFSVKKSEEGDSAVILVTTKGAIKEPFLNFLVEADWSKGRLLREFTVLLDPPFYADSPAPAPQPEPVAESATETVSEAETTQSVPEPIVESTDTSSDQSVIPEPIAMNETDSEPSDQTEQSTDDNSSVAEVLAMVESADAEQGQAGDVTVSKGDTLWGIAAGLQGSGQSMSQIMLAIQRANPEAFGDDNINNLKVGSVLRMPDASEIGAIDEQQAYAEVLQQNGLWDDYVARVTGVPAVATVETDTGSEVSEESQEAEAESTGELSLLTPGDGESDAAGLQNEGEDANELRVKLALAEEELDATQVENQELESRIAELEARLSKFEELQKMVEIEDDSLAKLQADQAQEEEVVSADAITEQQKATDEDELLDELLSEDTTTATEDPAVADTDEAVVESSDAMVEDETVAADSSDSTTETVGATEDSDALTDDTVEQEETSTAPPVPVIVTESEPESTSLLDGIIPSGILDMLPSMGDVMPSGEGFALDPLMLGGLGGIILLLIGLVFYKRKKASEEDEGEVMVNDPIFVADEDDEDDLTPIHLAEGAFEGLEDDSDISLPDESGIAETLMGSSQDDDEEDDEFARTAIVSPDNMPEPEAPAAPAVEEQDDILNEADVYLAYNLYDNAEELLTQSLETNPERADYRSKLLDTHFATKNTDAFIREAETLKSMGSAADRYWDRVLVMGHELAPGNALFAGAEAAGISAADLEFSKPAAADFDLGASEDDTNFSTTDFDLGEEDTNTFETTDYSSADIGSDDVSLEFPADDAEATMDVDISGNDDTNINAEIEEDTPDEIGDLDFSFDDDDATALPGLETEEGVKADDMDFELPDDLDLGSDDDDEESTAVIEAGTAVIDTEAFAAQLQDDDDVEEVEATAVIETESLGEGDLDFGMEDTAMMDQVTDDDDAELDLGDFDIESDDDDDAISMDIDMAVDNSKTDTFAPGDFQDADDSEESGFDDIEDLMLPDDVDEVSTKLDLARAFIDMGDAEGARSSLDEVLTEGNDEQKAEAQSLLDQL